MIFQCTVRYNLTNFAFTFRRRRSYPARADSDDRNKTIRFAVRSLGWTEIAEEDLTPERSSKAVNKCIVDLSLGRNDLLDVVGRWGDVSIILILKVAKFMINYFFNSHKFFDLG